MRLFSGSCTAAILVVVNRSTRLQRLRSGRRFFSTVQELRGRLSDFTSKKKSSCEYFQYLHCLLMAAGGANFAHKFLLLIRFDGTSGQSPVHYRLSIVFIRVMYVSGCSALLFFSQVHLGDCNVCLLSDLLLGAGFICGAEPFVSYGTYVHEFRVQHTAFGSNNI